MDVRSGKVRPACAGVFVVLQVVPPVSERSGTLAGSRSPPLFAHKTPLLDSR